MRIQLLSDLHFEFHRDGGRAFVQSLDPEGIDVLVLAGDIAVGFGITEALSMFCQRFPDATVLYVHGNHEFYNSNRSAVCSHSEQAATAHDNLRWLDCDVVEIGGQRFLGAPMWFAGSGASLQMKSMMNDFSCIDSFESWVYAENDRALQFFETELREGDIVITHYLPGPFSVPTQFKSSPLNPFFVCNVEPLIEERKPSHWLHGHTHGSVDVRVGDTRVLCNPFGYVGSELNPQFSDRFVVEI